MRSRLVRAIAVCVILSPPSHSQPQLFPIWNTFRYSDSVSIRYFKAGHGRQPVLLLHGLAASAATWIDMVQYLDCDCTIWALDLKGHGGSSKPEDHAYRLSDNVAIVRAFMDANQLRDLVLIGHSYGGAVALQTALDDNKERGSVKALILIGTPGTKQHFPLTITTLKYQKPARFFERFTPPELAAWVALHRVYYNHQAITPSRIALYSTLWRDPAGNRAMRETGAEFLDHGLKELAPEVHNISVPTLVIAGAHDPIVKPKYQRRLADHIQKAKYISIERCGHVPQEEYPADTARAIDSFILTVRNEPTGAEHRF